MGDRIDAAVLIDIDHFRVTTQPDASKVFFSFSAYSLFMFFFSIEGVLSARSFASFKPSPNNSLKALIILIFWAASTPVSYTHLTLPTN